MILQLAPEKLEHQRGDFIALVLERKVAGVEEMQLRIGQVE